MPTRLRWRTVALVVLVLAIAVVWYLLVTMGSLAPTHLPVVLSPSPTPTL